MQTKKTQEEIKAIRLANLRQNKKAEEEKNIIPRELEKIVFPHVRVLLSPAEFFLYCDELKAWVKDHPDWKMKEDIDDLNGIAMEKVIQFRLLSDKRARKTVDIDKEFTSSKNREMVNRNNLGARRQSRILEGQKSTTTNNIVSIIGIIEDSQIKKITEINQREQLEDDELFPKINFLDAEIVEEKKNG